MKTEVSRSKRIGLMGGSFDPLHTGHITIAQDAIRALELDELFLIPAATPPHKQGVKQVDIEQRLEMLGLALEGIDQCVASDVELQRGGVSYTYDTVCWFRKKQPQDQFVLIIGSDTLVDLHTWYRIDDLLRLCEVATFIRPGEDTLDIIRSKIELDDGARDRLMESIFQVHLVDLSSTEIRERIARGESIAGLVPPKVERYILKKGLYRD